MERTSPSVRHVSVVSIARRPGAAGAVEQRRSHRQPRWLAANEERPRHSLPLEGSPMASLEGSTKVSVIVWGVWRGVPHVTLTDLQSAVGGCGLPHRPFFDWEYNGAM